LTTVEELGSGAYVLITTFRKDGRAVPTPVWVAADGDALVVWSATDTGKVKRIRNSGEVTVAPCDVRGRPKGDAVPGHATLLDSAGTEHVRALLRRKYGLMGRLTLFGSRVRRGEDGSIGVRVVLT
jgi:PPOX class probable F420-dependent enzyme